MLNILIVDLISYTEILQVIASTIYTLKKRFCWII